MEWNGFIFEIKYKNPLANSLAAANLQSENKSRERKTYLYIRHNSKSSNKCKNHFYNSSQQQLRNKTVFFLSSITTRRSFDFYLHLSENINKNTFSNYFSADLHEWMLIYMSYEWIKKRLLACGLCLCVREYETWTKNNNNYRSGPLFCCWLSSTIWLYSHFHCLPFDSLPFVYLNTRNCVWYTYWNSCKECWQDHRQAFECWINL